MNRASTTPIPQKRQPLRACGRNAASWTSCKNGSGYRSMAATSFPNQKFRFWAGPNVVHPRVRPQLLAVANGIVVSQELRKLNRFLTIGSDIGLHIGDV